MSYRDYSVAKGHIVDITGHGDFTTVQAAIDAAVSGETIFLRPGIYTENLILKAGIIFSTFSGGATIVGKATFAANGGVTFTDIILQTNGDYFLEVSGSNPTGVIFENCSLLCSDHTGILLSSSNAGSQVNIFEGVFVLGNPAAAAWSLTGAGSMTLQNVVATNPGLSSTISNNSGGFLNIKNSNLPFLLGTTSTGGMLLDNCYLDCGALNAPALTANGSGSNVTFFTFLGSGTASAITVGTGATLICALCSVDSSNANAITGLGTLNAGIITFTGSGNTINTSTVNKLTTYGGTII